jgi:methylisocitrate lyase
MGMLGDFYSLEEYKRIVKAVNAPIVAVASGHCLFSHQPDINVDEWKAAGIKMVVYWHLPLFAAMKAVTKAVQVLKKSGTAEQMKDDLFTYSEYEDVMQLSKWLKIDEKYGEKKDLI